MRELISVIMSTFNTKYEYLNESISSILNQDYKNIEFIIVCDGNEDEFNYIRNSFKDDRIKLIFHNKNMGLPYSLNEAIKKANGKYIARMDSDDICLKKRLVIQKKYMDRHQHIQICGTFAKTFGDKNGINKLFYRKSDEIAAQILFMTVLCHPTVMFRASFFDNTNNFYNENYICAQDYELWSRAAAKDNIALLPIIGLKYRVHFSQAGQSRKNIQMNFTKKILRNNYLKICNSIHNNCSIEEDNNEILEMLETFYGLKQINQNNYLYIASGINKTIASQIYDSHILKKVLFNKYAVLLYKNGMFKQSLNKNIFHMVYNINNLIYCIWKFFCKIHSFIISVIELLKKTFYKLLRFFRTPQIIILRLISITNISLLDKYYIILLFKERMKCKLNLNNPQTFNEKLQWLKLYDRKDIYTTMVDKYEAKNYVADIIGENYIIPTLGIYDKFEEINFEKLPNQFVIKCTHDSGGLVIVKDKSKLDVNAARKKINKSLKKNYYYAGREWPYKNVKPRIIIEKYMEDKNDTSMHDYKFFCFNGEAKYCLVCTDRDTDLKETFFDINWNLAPFKRPNHDIDKTIKKPKNLDLMIELANKLSKGIPFIRVDFYEINGKVYFGELTFYPASGFAKFEPEEWDKKLGDLIDLSLVKKDEK